MQFSGLRRLVRPICTSLLLPSLPHFSLRRYATDPPTGVDEEDEMQRELERAMQRDDQREPHAALPSDITQVETKEDFDVHLERLARVPARYDILSNTSVYRWTTTAKLGRKICGPMREWGDEFKYRTGVFVDMEPIDPDKANSGGYSTADDVEVNVYFFGADRAVKQAASLIKAMAKQDPSYVRLAVFRRKEGRVEWLTLRRINRDNRPPDIPPISLKTPGKWTLLFENFKEAAIRTLWEETGIHVDEEHVFPTGMLRNSVSQFFWRVPVRYFIAEVPATVEVLGPQANTTNYMCGWDPKVLRNSSDPIDQAWAAFADPQNCCAWLTAKQIDELQFPLKGERYMTIRYTPSPKSGLQPVVQLFDEGSPQPGSI